MAYSFNGSNQLLFTTSTPIANGTGNVTLSAWFYANSLTTNMALLAIDHPDALGRYILAVRGASAGDPVTAEYGKNDVIYSAATTTGASTGVWMHAAATFVGSTSRSAYINGSSKGTNTQSVSFAANPTVMRIGALSYNAPTGIQAATNGLIAEAAIWNTNLTDEEIASLAAGFTPDNIRPQSLQFYAPLVRHTVDVRNSRSIGNANSATVAVHPRIIL